jgi:hypothetical protein
MVANAKRRSVLIQPAAPGGLIGCKEQRRRWQTELEVAAGNRIGHGHSRKKRLLAIRWPSRARKEQH